MIKEIVLENLERIGVLRDVAITVFGLIALFTPLLLWTVWSRTMFWLILAVGCAAVIAIFLLIRFSRVLDLPREGPERQGHRERADPGRGPRGDAGGKADPDQRVGDVSSSLMARQTEIVDPAGNSDAR